MAVVTTLRMSGCTWVDKARPGVCFFNKTGYLAVRGGASPMGAFVSFLNPFSTLGRQNVVRATLTLRSRLMTAGAHSVTVRPLSSPVVMSSSTWARDGAKVAPAGVAGVTVSQAATADNTLWTFDVTDVMQQVADGAKFYGFSVATSDASLLLFQGNMGGSIVPVLTVETTSAPLPPESLSPAAGRVVGTPSPVLRFNFEDHQNRSTIAAARVQLSSSATFASVAWDSGAVVTTLPQLDLAKAGAPAAASGAAVWWRVMVRDSSGLWSSWSAATSYVYVPRPTVTLLNPDASSPMVFDSTPPIDWAVTGLPAGAAVERWRVVVYRRWWGEWQQWATSGVVVGSASTWTLDRALPRNGEYRVGVQVWDTLDREATPGVADYAAAYQDFTYTFDATADAPTNLVATQRRPMPTVTLTWNYASQPDSWHVTRDGKALADYPGGALLQAGKTNAYRIPDFMTPGGWHTWQVFPVVNGRQGTPATVRAYCDQVGTWLYDEDDMRMVCIVGDTDHDIAYTEDSATIDVLGSPMPVVISSGLNGYSGTVSGMLLEIEGMPANQTPEIWFQNLMEFREDKGRVIRLLTNDRELYVRVYNVTGIEMSQASNHRGYTASFNFYQCDDFDFGTE